MSDQIKEGSPAVAGYPVTLVLVCDLVRGLQAIEGGFMQTIHALARHAQQDTMLFRDLCQLRVKFDAIADRLQPSMLYEDDCNATS